jgi:hypothetical protein
MSNSDLFEIDADSDEMFLPVLNSSNIVVSNTTISNPTTIASNSGVSIS